MPSVKGGERVKEKEEGESKSELSLDYVNSI